MKLSRLINFFKQLYIRVLSSIAFYPSLMAIAFLLLAWTCLYIDSVSLEYEFMNWISFLIVRNPDTARTLLGVLAGGLISLMVFSFSMVMIVLNQAATSYSPRVLPDLVSKREHQFVMGTYLGTIGFTFAVLSNIDSETFEVLVPRFSIVVNLLLVLGCFIAFIYFIHDISSTIQVGNIINRLYLKTRDRLREELSGEKYSKEPLQFKEKQVVKAWQSGYFFNVTEKSLLKGAQKHHMKVVLLKTQGQYVLKGEDFLWVDQPVNQEIEELLVENIIFRHQELIEENYYYGFKQITEIAVKALSPGINDPGTALQAIDYLMDLFQMLLQLEGRKMCRGKDGTPVLVYSAVSFQTVFSLCLSSIRNYAGEDVVVLAKLIELIHKSNQNDREGRYRAVFRREMQAMEEIAAKGLTSSADKEFIFNLLRKNMHDHAGLQSPVENPGR